MINMFALAEVVGVIILTPLVAIWRLLYPALLILGSLGFILLSLRQVLKFYKYLVR